MFYISLELTDDDDEIMITLGEVLGGFTELCGGPAHVFTLSKTLETLACAEESTVRDQVMMLYVIK